MRPTHSPITSLTSLFLGLAVALAPAPGGAAPKKPETTAKTTKTELVKEVAVSGTSLTLGAIVPGTGAPFAAVELGVVPPMGGARVVTKAEMLTAIEAQIVGKPKLPTLPEAVRVVRKTQKLTAPELDKLVRDAFAKAKVRKGASLATVKAGKLTEVPDGYQAVRLEVPKIPRKSGTISSFATLAFVLGDVVVHRVNVPLELSLAPECALPDVASKGQLTLVIHRGAVEIDAPAVAQSDADIGDVLLVQVTASGKLMKATLVSAKRAAVVEGS